MDDSGSYAAFTEQGSSAPEMTAAKVMDIISRLPGCAGQAADAVSAHTQVKMEDAPNLLKIPTLECPEIWIARVDGASKACPTQAAADARGSRTCMRASTLVWVVAHAGGEGRINVLPWYLPVGVAIPPVIRKGGRTGLPARVSGRHVARG